MSNINLQKANDGGLPNALQSASAIHSLHKAATRPDMYQSRVTRKTPAGIVLLLDQSGSMSLKDEDGRSMAQRLAQMVNQYLDGLYIKANKPEGVRDYYQVAVVGYGSENEYGEEVHFAWQGKLKGKEWVWVSEWSEAFARQTVKNSVVKTIFGEKPKIEVIKEWIDPVDDGGCTPMKAAFEKAEELMRDWAIKYPDSYPPIVFNVTDGEATDIDSPAELLAVTDRIKAITTKDGNALIYNVLLADGDSMVYPEDYLNHEWESENHKTLFKASSVLPIPAREAAYQIYGYDRLRQQPTRCVVLNAPIGDLVRMLNIGTPTTVPDTHQAS